MRRTPFVGLLVGVTLLAAGLLLTADAVAREGQLRRTLHRDAEQVSASFSAHFERIRSLTLLLAQVHASAPAEKANFDRERANEALAYLDVLYPGLIGEAGIIDERGRELARVTAGEPAPEAELSLDETENPFFTPTLALGRGQVYRSPPYVSPLTGRWVISNATWIRRAHGGRLIVHFEVSLASFARHVDTRAANSHVAVVRRGTGQIVLQNRTALPPSTSEGRFHVTAWSDGFTNKLSAAGTTSVDGYVGVYRHVARGAGNANDWYVVEWSAEHPGLLPAWARVAAGILGMILIAIALFGLRRRQRTLRLAARVDHLTGLANRKALEEALDEALDGARSVGDFVAVLTLDLYGFKQVNNALGHDKGDLVIREAARRLQANVFGYDTTARLDGDEFAVVVRHLRDVDDVAAVAHRLREALSWPIDIDGMPVFLGATIGAVTYPHDGRTSEDLLRAADAAMHRLKHDRERVRV